MYFYVMHYPVMIVSNKIMELSIGSVPLLGIVLIAFLTIAIPTLTKSLADRSALIRGFFVRPVSVQRQSAYSAKEKVGESP